MISHNHRQPTVQQTPASGGCVVRLVPTNRLLDASYAILVALAAGERQG